MISSLLTWWKWRRLRRDLNRSIAARRVRRRRNRAEVLVIIRPARRTRLAIFMRDALKRSSWGCPRALTRYAIDAANAALMGRFQ